MSIDSKRKQVETKFMPGGSQPLDRKRAHGQPPIEHSILPKTVHPAAKGFLQG
jgi:hypothetical protein